MLLSLTLAALVAAQAPATPEELTGPSSSEEIGAPAPVQPAVTPEQDEDGFLGKLERAGMLAIPVGLVMAVHLVALAAVPTASSLLYRVGVGSPFGGLGGGFGVPTVATDPLVNLMMFSDDMLALSLVAGAGLGAILVTALPVLLAPSFANAVLKTWRGHPVPRRKLLFWTVMPGLSVLAVGLVMEIAMITLWGMTAAHDAVLRSMSVLVDPTQPNIPDRITNSLQRFTPVLMVLIPLATAALAGVVVTTGAAAVAGTE